MGDFEWGWLKLNPDFFLVLYVILLNLLLMILSSKCNELNYHVDSINKNDIFHSRQVRRPGDSSIVFLSKYFSFLTFT